MATPTVTVSPEASAALREAIASEPGTVVHVSISARFAYDVFLAPAGAADVVAATDPPIHFDGESAGRAHGLTIGFEGEGFRLTSPSEPARVRQLSVRDYQALRARNEPHVLVDVRTIGEWNTAKIEGARRLDDELGAELAGLPRETKLVFQCHHGMRSQAAAQRYAQLGFRDVWNLAGGIDAWSLEVDPKVPRY